jgi:hypothetical protein
MLLCGFSNIVDDPKIMKQILDGVLPSSSWTLYLDAMKPPLTQYKYQGNRARFLDFTRMEVASLEERAQAFADHGMNKTELVFRIIIEFVHYPK